MKQEAEFEVSGGWKVRDATEGRGDGGGFAPGGGVSWVGGEL